MYRASGEKTIDWKRFDTATRWIMIRAFVITGKQWNDIPVRQTEFQ